ncbi:MAG TPA: VOC family protein [Panacibacter sp.]|nr:VOC family protein [Panacibacter sp.]
MQKTITSLMFVGDQSGKAEEAINFYTSLLKNSELKNIQYYKAGEQGGKDGYVKHATFTLAGQEYMALDSALEHKFSFTPSISIFVNCENEEEIDTLFKKLLDSGSAFMPLGNYGFSKKFAWLKDRYGVSWQMSLT